MATICTGPFWVDHFQDGNDYAVDHLRPVIIDYDIPAVERTKKKPGRAAITVKLRITYSHHCFTQALDKVPGANAAHYYNCTKRPNETRVFCPIRWNESLALPAIVMGIKNCYFTRHENYFIWRNPTNSQWTEYFVYFNVRRRKHFVEMEIESAYSRNDAAQARAGAQKVSLTNLIVNTVNGKETHRPPDV